MSLRVCTYSRVSTAHHEQKPEVQAEELRRYCEARGWVLVEEIVDHGYSGRTGDRPGFHKLMEMVRTRRVDGVVVLKLDRLFRSLRHLVTTLDEFQTLGITFVAVADSVDYTSPSGRLLVQIMGSLAEFERAIGVERVKLGLAHAKRKGKILGRPKTRDDKAILELRAKGLSYSEIMEQLGISRGAISRALFRKPPKGE